MDDEADEFGSVSNSRKCKNPFTKTATYAVVIGWSVLLILATMGVTVVIGVTTDWFCDCSGGEEAAKVAAEYRQAVNAFSQGYSTDVCYDGMDEDAPHVYGIFTLEGVGSIPRRAQVDGRVCYPEIVPWQAFSPDDSSSSSSEAEASIWS